MNADRLPRAWLIVGVLWVVAVLNYLDRIMITTMRDSLTRGDSDDGRAVRPADLGVPVGVWIAQSVRGFSRGSVQPQPADHRAACSCGRC